MPVFSFEFDALGGACELTFTAQEEGLAQIAAQAAVDEIQRIEFKYSRYRDDSLLSTINQRAGTGVWTSCDEETIQLLKLADRLYKDSEGLFDITSGVLRKAWNFNNPILPSHESLSPLLQCVDWLAVEISNNQIHLSKPGMELDFGGFGKEYAVDQAAERIKAHGVSSGIVNLGGDVRVIGPQEDGSPWVIGIRNPRENEQLLASIPIAQGALASSGDYERYFELDGKRYCHILNPRTGYPVSYWRSVSVIASNALTAGCLSTLTMLREEAGLNPLKNLGFEYCLVDRHGNLFTSGH